MKRSRSSFSNLQGTSKLSVEWLRILDAKRQRRFHYDPSKLSELWHYWNGTLLPVVLLSPFFWFNIVLFVFIAAVQRWLAYKGDATDAPEFVKLSALATPGALFSFFITGQLGRTIHTWSLAHKECRKLAQLIRSITVGFTFQPLTEEQYQIARKITKALQAAMLFTFINVTDYMEQLDPSNSDYMIETELITHEEAAGLCLNVGPWQLSKSEQGQPPTHYTSGHEKIQQVLRLFFEAKEAGVPAVGNWSPHIQVGGFAGFVGAGLLVTFYFWNLC